ncbi:MAG TPA: helix-turn-helix domain-containing protein, partial [Thermomicrobiales bacterium]|nr:helix-turn-helix domain-containing protein [Thermomicrobiales bacterium]
MDASGTHDFGAALRRCRLAAALSQEALAERAGLSARGISDLERGARRAPRMATVQMLIDALGLRGAERNALLAAARRSLGDLPRDFGLETPPVWPHRIIGREREIGDIAALLRRDDVRLVTLTGPGGIGKTHLALVVAAAMAAHFADGVAFVDLAPVRDPALVAAVFAHAVGLRDRGDHPLTEQLRAHLAERSLLAIVDNCEHLAPAMPLLADLLRACPRVKMLATSRDRLRLRGERDAPVGPLALLPPDAPAPSVARLAEIASIRLFVERAAAIRPGFALTPENAAAVAALCRRLDGLPLAIELAATQIKALPPAALLARLERRLPALIGARDLPERQRTLSATIAWSYDLLALEEQALFRRLSAFVGPFSLDAAEWIAADAALNEDAHAAAPAAIDLLAALLDQNLIRRDDEADDAAAPRFAMLETIRRFAAERLEASGDAPFVRDRHAAYVLALAERAAPELFGPREREWLATLERERGNLWAALDWAAASGDRATLLRLVAALW